MDKRSFEELGKQVQEVRMLQDKVKWYLVGGTATLSVVASVSLYVYRMGLLV